ncbi:MAG: hypothetical protein DSY70_07415 [Desulfobulbus sp.]|nr:MAG: hypothetical protein DSY70_07415 [Desulfobulbus sp.]
MKTDKCRPVDDTLRIAIASLEMEISDTILEDLLTALAKRRKDDANSHAADILLQNMESVAKHIDTLRVKSDLRAFSLIDELWDAYAEITLGLTDDESFILALAKTQDVLDWQQQCLINALEKQTTIPAKAASLPSPAVAQLIQEQITKTGSFVRHEIESLKSLAGVAPFPANQPQQVSEAMTEQIHDLQELFQQEINKLRLEIHPDSDQPTR